MLRKSKKGNHINLSALKKSNKKAKKMFWLSHHLWLTHNICSVVTFAYYLIPLNCVHILAVGFHVLTTCALLQNLIRMLLQSPFDIRISCIALNYIITLFICQYTIQWDKMIFCGVYYYFGHNLRPPASYSER